MEVEIDVLGLQFFDEVQQVFEQAAQAIDRPRRDHVELFAGDAP
jgi:hypothetical protein